MSKLTDYSKFDHLETDSSDDEEQEQQNSVSIAAPPAAAAAAPAPNSSIQTTGAGTTSASAGTSAPARGIFRRHMEHANRFVFEYPPGNPIYEWEQTLDSVTLLIRTPSAVVTRADQLDCRIHPNRLQVGLRGVTAPFFLDEATAGTLDVHNSTWTWEDDVLTMELFKANKGVVWSAVTLGSSSSSSSSEAAADGGGGMVANNNNNNNNNSTTAAQLDPIQLQEEQKRLLLERWQEENPGMDFRNAEFNGSVPDPRTFMGGVRYD